MNKNNTVEITDFVYLMFISLADISKIKYGGNIKILLPSNYKQIIENILCSDSVLRDEFSKVINIEEYFNDHFKWEEILSKTIKKILLELNKDCEYDIVYDMIIINFKEEEINNFKSIYQEKEINDIMYHFIKLLVDYMYSREYQEEFYDYNADTVRKMHKLRTEYYHKKDISRMADMFSTFARDTNTSSDIEAVNVEKMVKQRKINNNIRKY